MTPAGLEPAIPGSVGRCLIHWATGPMNKDFDGRSGARARRQDGQATPEDPGRFARRGRKQNYCVSGNNTCLTACGR